MQAPSSASTVTSAGQVIVGGWLSTTVTVCWQVFELPFMSTTVHVTVVLPTGNDDGASLLVPAIPQLSEVTGVPRATPEAVQRLASASTVTFAGQSIVGGSLSL